MSMYNAVFGVNRGAGILMKLLGLEPADVGRFRDAFLQRRVPSGELEIYVYTRNGGGNRPDYADVAQKLSEHPLYLRDFDDSFDSTYASFVFRVPPVIRSQLELFVEQYPEMLPKPPAERFQEVIQKVQTEPNDPQVVRAQEALRPLFEEIAKKL